LPAPIRGGLRRCLWKLHLASAPDGSSAHCEVIYTDISTELLRGWKDPSVAAKQQAAFNPVLDALRQGKPREDFTALAAAVERTQIRDPLIVEVGCGSGWNSEVLERLLDRPVRYVGMDYAHTMVALGKRTYTSARFVTGDATALPFHDAACDILLSGTVLMHLLGYRRAIAESRRVSRRWCIFHTVPVVHARPTSRLKKRAYGSPVVEIVFNEQELQELFETNQLALRATFPSIRHAYLDDLLSEPVQAQTYLCEIR
jgi:SAM-dependent methyltransferase